MHSFRGLTLLFCLSALASVPAIAQSVPTELISQSKDPAPLVADGTGSTFFSFSPNPYINASGQLLVHGNVSVNAQVDASNNSGLWVLDDGSSRKVFREGETAPGVTDQAMFDGPVGFFTRSFNDAGQAAFVTQLSGSSVDTTNNNGLWAERDNQLRLVARTGQTPVGVQAGLAYDWLNAISFNEGSSVAFRAQLSGNGVTPSDTVGIWSDAGGQVELVALTGQQAPGLEAGTVFAELDAPLLNDQGLTIFRGRYPRASNPNILSTGIWAHQNGQTQLLFTGASEGIAHNNAGQIAFRGSQSTSYGMLIYDNGVFTDVALRGEQVPGMEAGVTFSNFGLPELNDAGQTAFVATFEGPGVNSSNNTALWIEIDGQLHMIAREGDAAPGSTPGVTMENLGHPTLNNLGQVVFKADLNGPDINPLKDGAYFGTTADGELGLIIHEGQAFDHDLNGDSNHQQIDVVNLHNVSGSPYALSDNGEVVYTVAFRRNSIDIQYRGLYVADLGRVVPEPGSAAVLGLAGLALLRRRR